MRKKTSARKPNSAGFTLIELMIAVAIVGILGTIAAVSYSSQIQKSRRTDARSALLDLAGREEKLFSTTNAYGNSPAVLGYGTLTSAFSMPVGNNYYNVTVQVPDPNTPLVAGSYLITATAINQQANDTQCATMSVNQLGVQSATPVANTAMCWGR